MSGANQPLRANFNLGHQINIQRVWGDWVFYNLDPPLDWVITLLQISPPTSLRPSSWILI